MNEKKGTHYKNFHKGFNKRKGRGMTEGDVAERLGCIKVQVFKWDDNVPIGVRNLKEILARCGYYLSREQICKLSREGKLEGYRLNNRFWIYPKPALYRWIKYLEESGVELLKKRKIIKEEDSVHIPGRIR